jgi:hemerythrin-like domain-containing protein
MTETEIGDRVVHEHTELQEYLLQWEAALLQFEAGDFTGWQRNMEQLWRLVPFLDKELPRHFRTEEEQLFPRVEARHPDSVKALAGFLGEHAELARDWRLYKQDLLYCDAVGCTQPARESGLGLITRLRQHIREEEQALLPLLEAA